MNEDNSIEAHVRMEERYQSLSLAFTKSHELKAKILSTIDEVKEITGQTPFIFEKVSNDRADLQAIYIEFRDDIHREGGAFLTMMLKKLNIDKCVEDVI